MTMRSFFSPQSNNPTGRRLLRFLGLLSVLASCPTWGQSLDDYRSAMQSLGCGAAFSQVVDKPVPLRGFTEESERRLDERSGQFKMTATGVIAVSERTRDIVLQVLLLNPINAIDKMNPDVLRNEFALYLGHQQMPGGTPQADFEKNVAATLLCVMEKRKGIKPEAQTNNLAVAALGGDKCGGDLDALFEFYPKGPQRDLLMKQIRTGQTPTGNGRAPTGRGKRSSSYDATNYTNGYDPVTTPAPSDFADAVAMWATANSIKANILELKKQLPLVPSPAQLSSWKASETKIAVTMALATYWVCQRASQENHLLETLLSNPTSSFYWTAWPALDLDDSKVEDQILRLYQTRFENRNGLIVPVAKSIFSCTLLATNGRAPAGERKYPLCEDYPGGKKLPELETLIGKFNAAFKSHNVLFVGAQNAGSFYFQDQNNPYGVSFSTHL